MPGVGDLVAAWQDITSSLAALSTQYGKQVVFTEIGYCANGGANVDPAHANRESALLLALPPPPFV